MIYSAGFVVAVGIFTVFQFHQLWSRSEKREAIIYALFMAASAVIGSLLIAGIDIPSQVLPYKIFFESIGKSILSP